MNKGFWIAGGAFAAIVVLVVAFGRGPGAPTAKGSGDGKSAGRIRVGYFPNITHSQALVGLKRGTFRDALGKDVEIESKVFNAGPAEIEALFAGAVFVVRKDAGIDSPKDLEGKLLASPQLGNTQDVALRSYIKKHGLKLKDDGGTVDVQPVENADILTLFNKKELDGAWVPEPWGTRLVKEGGGKIFLDERELWPRGRFVTGNVIVKAKFLKEHPDLVDAWLKGHVETTQWIDENPEKAQTVLNGEIKKLSGKSLPQDVLKRHSLVST